MANEVVQTLSQLARNGRTIVATVHSPSSRAFAKFNDLMMLDNGQLLYAGTVTGVQSYFESLGFVRGDISLPEWIVDLTAAEAVRSFALQIHSDHQNAGSFNGAVKPSESESSGGGRARRSVSRRTELCIGLFQTTGGKSPHCLEHHLLC